MELPSSFVDFLSNIRLTKNQRDDLITGHKTLRERLLADETLSKIIVSTFLQGSYRRHTATRPANEKRSDVDVIVVTTLAESQYTPQAAMNLFVAFLDKHYKGKWKFQGRSIAIELSYVDLDLVLTSAPSEAQLVVLRSVSMTIDETAEDFGSDWPLATLVANASYSEVLKAKPQWKIAPLRIPDRDAAIWEDTHPLAQINWTWAKNKACNGHYINVVKAIKWWRRVMVETPEYPKGYPVEHLVGACCPDNITSVAEGVTKALEEIVARYANIAAQKTQPYLRDHGVDHNVMHRVTGADFAAFYAHIVEAAKTARAALDATTVKESSTQWRKLFGDKFPESSGSESVAKGFTERDRPSTVGSGRFARNA
jgi:hypothetical protein